MTDLSMTLQCDKYCDCMRRFIALTTEGYAYALLAVCAMLCYAVLYYALCVCTLRVCCAMLCYAMLAVCALILCLQDDVLLKPV